MTQVAVTFCTAGNRSVEGGSMPVPRLPGAIGELITTGATSVATAQACPADAGTTGFVSITAFDGDVWVSAGAEPVALAGSSGFPVLSGQTRDFAVAAGDKIAAVDL